MANLLLVKVLRAPLWLLLSAALARVLGPDGLGAWSMILAAAMLLNQVLLHWTQSITQSFGRIEWLATQQLDSTFGTRWPLLVVGFTIAILMLVFTPFSWPQRFYGLDDHLYWYILPVMLTFWLMAEVQSLQQVRERFVLLAWSPLLADLLLLTVIAVLMLISVRFGALDSTTVFATLFSTSFCVWLLWLAYELRSFHLRWQWPQHSLFSRAVVFAAPLVPGFLIGYLAEWGDYFLISHFYSEREVGLFHPAYQYLLIIVGLPTALAAVLTPKIVAVHPHDEGLALRRLIIRHAPQFTLLWSMAILPLIAVLPVLFGSLLGAEYSSSQVALQALLLAVPGAVVLHVYGLACFVQGRLGVSIVGFFATKSLVNLALSFWLLPILGITGSAIGSAVSYVLLQWLLLLDQHRQLRLEPTKDVCALLFAQFAGLLLVFVDGLWPRLLIAILVVLLMLAWARRIALFSVDEISATLPSSMQWLENPLQRLLCRAF